MRITTIFLMCVASSLVMAQDSSLTFTVTGSENSISGGLEMIITFTDVRDSSIKGGKVVVTAGTTQFLTTLPDRKGRVVFKLPFMEDYQITFTAPGYATRIIRVATLVPFKDQFEDHSFKFDTKQDRWASIGNLNNDEALPSIKLAYDSGFGDFYYVIDRSQW